MNLLLDQCFDHCTEDVFSLWSFELLRGRGGEKSSLNGEVMGLFDGTLNKCSENQIKLILLDKRV